MKNIILPIISVIGIYTLLRNNVCAIEGQIIWSYSPDLFYKVFLPLLMVASSIAALIFKNKINFFILSISITAIDAINRLAVLVNWLSLPTFEDTTISESAVVETVVQINLLPSGAILLAELVILAIIIKKHYPTESIIGGRDS